MPSWRRLGELHHLLYPAEVDLATIAILIVLETGLEPESLRDLTTDCLRNPNNGYVELEYLKRRRHGHEWNRLRIRDGNATTAGGLIRLAKRLTAQARSHAGGDGLWLCYQPRAALLKVSVLRWHRGSGTDVLVSRYQLAMADGTPLVIDLRRLRKSFKAEFYRATGGRLPLLARGHSREVAASRYADIPALRATHEAAIADGLTEALADTASPTVIPVNLERHLVEDPQSAAQAADLEPRQTSALLAGDLDMWLSACRDLTNSPYGTPGQACPVPFWHCLDCSNAVVTSRKLPAVLAFLDHISAQRTELDTPAWAAAFGRAYQRITT